MSTLLTDMTDEELNVTLSQLFPSNPTPKRNRNRRRFGPPPPKRKHTSIQPKKPYTPVTEPITPTETITAVEAITAIDAALPIPTIATTPSSVTDPFAYVMDVYDNFIAPGIVAETKTLEAIRRGLYRRAVAEFATDEIKAISALRSITVEDILTIILSSVHKSGLILV